MGTRWVHAFLAESLNMGQILPIVEQMIAQNFGIDRWIDILLDPCSERFPLDEQMCGPGGGSVIDTSEVLQDSIGVLGIPNPNQTRQKTAKAVNSAASSGQGMVDVFEINPTVYSVYAANQQDRLNTRAAIETVLGNSGQKQMKKELDSTEETVKTVVEDADAAQSLDVTQDVMKKMARIAARDSILLGAIRADALQARVDTQFTNLNLMNASRTLDELARTRRTETSANAMYLLEISGQAQLN